MDIYVLERLVKTKLAEARAEAAREALVASLRAGRPGLRAVVGLALIRTGRWLRRRAIHRRAPVGTEA